MKIDVEIQFHGEKILVNSKQKNYHREYKNVIAFGSDNKIVAIGQTLDELIAENPQYEDRFKKEVKFEPLYTADRDGLEKVFIFIIYESTKILHGEMILSRLLNLYSLTCFLELPDYEKISKDFRNHFEYLLLKNGISELYINGLIGGWKKWQRNTLKLSNFVTQVLSFLLWFMFMIITNQYKGLWDWNLGLLALVFFIFIMSIPIIYYFLVLIRILILRTFLPLDLLRLELAEQGKGFEKVWTRFLTSLLDEK